MALYYTNLENARKLLSVTHPTVKLCNWESWGEWYCHQYFQIKPDGYPSGIHFEYHIPQNPNRARGRGLLELHLEPHSEEDKIRFKRIGIRLMHLLSENTSVQAVNRNNAIPIDTFIFNDNGIETDEQLVEAFIEFFEIVDCHVRELLSGVANVKLDCPYKEKDIEYKPFGSPLEDVSVRIMSLEDVMSYNLSLPDYQREYCWEDKNIIDLWHNLKNIHEGKPFHLGTIILHDYKNKYDIIDGQQRLITLSIILWALGYKEYLPLLNASYDSIEAQEHIANCKYIVQTLVSKEKNTAELVDVLSKNISFSVLTVNEANLDLAYTFFSNQNSKGVPLSDFDLLKAHHLRFVPNDGQAEHMAVKWNRLTMLPNIYKEKNALHRVLGIHIYRLRRWMRKNQSHEGHGHYVQEEYQSAATMSDIPPFGEKFDFYEKIQGGTHFFVYAETFIHRYQEFLKNPIIETLQNNLAWGSYEIYSDSIETVLFGYYLKFGNQYLAEALYCIAQILALHRYNSNRVASDGTGVRGFINEAELVLMIDQASSPTFFLAEVLLKHDQISQKDNWINSGMDLPEMKGVKWNMYKMLKNISHVLLPEISESVIRKRIIEEYGK